MILNRCIKFNLNESIKFKTMICIKHICIENKRFNLLASSSSRDIKSILCTINDRADNNKEVYSTLTTLKGSQLVSIINKRLNEEDEAYLIEMKQYVDFK